MANVNEINHPLLQEKLSRLRNRQTKPPQFRSIMNEISRLLAYEVTRDLKTTPIEVETPIQKTRGMEVKESLLIVPIMRAGNGMLEGFMRMLPFAQVGHIGIYRDRFVDATVEYYCRLPEATKGLNTILLDPLLASGSTAVAAISRLKRYELGRIHFVCILAAPDGVRTLQEHHPDVSIHCLSVEERLDDQGYIVPGVGDAGARLYGIE